MFSYEVNIVCDNYKLMCPSKQACQTSEPLGTGDEGEYQVLVSAKELGWAIINGKHYCPDCVENMLRK